MMEKWKKLIDERTEKLIHEVTAEVYSYKENIYKILDEQEQENERLHHVIQGLSERSGEKGGFLALHIEKGVQCEKLKQVPIKAEAVDYITPNDCAREKGGFLALHIEKGVQCEKLKQVPIKAEAVDYITPNDCAQESAIGCESMSFPSTSAVSAENTKKGHELRPDSALVTSVSQGVGVTMSDRYSSGVQGLEHSSLKWDKVLHMLIRSLRERKESFAAFHHQLISLNSSKDDNDPKVKYTGMKHKKKKRGKQEAKKVKKNCDSGSRNMEIPSNSPGGTVCKKRTNITSSEEMSRMFTPVKRGRPPKPIIYENAALTPVRRGRPPKAIIYGFEDYMSQQS